MSLCVVNVIANESERAEMFNVLQVINLRLYLESLICSNSFTCHRRIASHFLKQKGAF